MPRPTKLRNNYSSRSRPQFVRGAIDDLVHKGAVSELEIPPIVVNPLTVSVKGEKQCLVLDLRHINPHVFKQPCKIEGPETLAKYLPRSTHLFGFDLKAGYHHVDIIPRHRSYLGFAYTDHRGKERFYAFNVLPFGFGPAGFIFTKLLRVLVKIWRAKSIRAVIFFDDGVVASYSYQEGVSQAVTV